MCRSSQCRARRNTDNVKLGDRATFPCSLSDLRPQYSWIEVNDLSVARERGVLSRGKKWTGIPKGQFQGSGGKPGGAWRLERGHFGG